MPRHPPYALTILTLTSFLLLSKNIANLQPSLQLSVFGCQVLVTNYNYQKLITIYGGGERDRTDDPLLAKQVLSQLSYTPT